MAWVAGDYCAKAVTCAGITEADCISAAKTGIDCTGIKGENGQLTTCDTDLASETCAAYFSSADSSIHLPASCAGVFLK